MNEIIFIPTPNKLYKALLKEDKRLEVIKKSSKHPFIKKICKRRQDLIFELLNGRERE